MCISIYSTVQSASARLIYYSNLIYSAYDKDRDPLFDVSSAFQNMHCSQGLIARGRVHGTVELCDCVTVTSETLEHSFDKHQVSDLSIIKYATVYAWVFTNATAFNEPVRHLPKQSCRIWMQIEYPKNATRIRKCIQEAQTVDVTDMDQINDIATKAGLTNFPKYKTTYFRAMDKEADYHEKFFYVLENAASVKASLMRALTFCLTVNELQDSADCMQMAEVKAAIKETGATAKRSVADARKQWMGIALTQELKKIRNNKAVQEIVEVPAAEEGVAADAEGASTAGSGTSAQPSGQSGQRNASSCKGEMICNFFESWLYTMQG